MSTTNKPRIDLSQVGEADKRNLARTFLEAIERFYEDPVNRERFEKWQKEQAHDTQPVKGTRTSRKGRCLHGTTGRN